jgi:hypothetical protein
VKYKYKPYTSVSGDLLTFPIVNVTLTHGRKRINIDCLVDSGASESLFSFDIAALLGIDLNEATPQEYVGIGNVVLQGYKSGVQLKLTGFDKWITFEAGFIKQNEMPLLGHSGFFENFEITFRAIHRSALSFSGTNL